MEVGSQETVDGFRDEFQDNFSDLETGVGVSVLFQKVGHGGDWVVQHEASGLVHSSKHFRTLFRESGTVEEVVGDRLLSFGVEAVARFAVLVHSQSVAKEKAVERDIPHAHPGELFVDPVAAEKEVLGFGERRHMLVEWGAVPDVMAPFTFPLLKGSLLMRIFQEARSVGISKVLTSWAAPSSAS